MVTRSFGVLNTLGTQKASVRVPRKIGKTVHNANKSCSNAVWHPHCSPAPANRSGRAPSIAAGTDSVFPLPLHSAGMSGGIPAQEHPLQTAGDETDFQVQAFCRQIKRSKADVRQSAVQLSSCRHPFAAVTLSRGEGEKNQPPSSVLIFTDGAALMLSNPPEGGNSISFVPRISKWLKMAISTDINFIKGGVFPRALRRLGQEPAGDALHVNIYC